MLTKNFLNHKKEYDTRFVKLITDIRHTSITTAVKCSKVFYTFLTSESPDKWIFTGILSRWTKEIAEIFIEQNKPNEENSLFFSYDIMADKSTRGEKKVFILCFIHWNWIRNESTMTVVQVKDFERVNAINVAKVALECCTSNSLNSAKCAFWFTDNTFYISEIAHGAVAEFNKLANSNSTRIPCGLHVIHIAWMSFQNNAFGKLDAHSGIS